ncbi:RelA/SpoT domain-containing protein [Paenibacillus pabuli]|uniref:RelA/SpoT domain-containing protein n=1 Tax=Paenibacillus pabuli TaxID=1472 RepID=UPI0032429EB1
MNKDQLIIECIDLYRREKKQFQLFLNSIRDFFELDPPINETSQSVIHSIKYRLKDEDHLAEKVNRKSSTGNPINVNNLFSRVTDLAGLRILHLYQDQFPIIHEKIMNKVRSKDWYFVEPPKAYTWDPETVNFFSGLGIQCEQKESYYTSIHYLVKQKDDTSIICEIQVRTLFEEIWGEIDHSINYPQSIDSVACKEQIRVLSKLVSTGTRLADSIFRTYNDYKTQVKEIQDEEPINFNEDIHKNSNSKLKAHESKVVQQYLLTGNSNWFDQVASDLNKVIGATFMWPNGYWPFEKIASKAKPQSGDYFVVGYKNASEKIVGVIKYAGIKSLTDIIAENELAPNERITNGFSDVNNLRKFVNNRREVGCITIENIRMVANDEYNHEFGEFKETYAVRQNSLFIHRIGVDVNNEFRVTSKL